MVRVMLRVSDCVRVRVSGFTCYPEYFGGKPRIPPSCPGTDKMRAGGAGGARRAGGARGEGGQGVQDLQKVQGKKECRGCKVAEG